MTEILGTYDSTTDSLMRQVRPPYSRWTIAACRVSESVTCGKITVARPCESPRPPWRSQTLSTEDLVRANKDLAKLTPVVDAYREILQLREARASTPVCCSNCSCVKSPLTSIKRSAESKKGQNPPGQQSSAS